MQLDAHLLLVSSQPTPNLSPLLDPQVGASRVWLLVSPDMQMQSQWLTNVLRARGVQVSEWSLQDPFDLAHISERVMLLLEQHPELSIALNATGGTKPMSIAAYEVFRAYGKPIYYVNPGNDTLSWLSPRDDAPHALSDRLKLPEFLMAHGASDVDIGSRGNPDRGQREFAASLVRRVDQMGKSLGVINFLANSAEKHSELCSSPMSPAQLQNLRLQALIDEFVRHDILSVRNNCLCFADEKRRFFANGGWFEEYVYQVVAGLRADIPSIQDVGCSITISRFRNGDIRNELDVAFLANNRLYIIECKTKKWQSGSEGANALYKLDSLSGLLGGMQARAMLASYRPLRGANLRRAQELDIATCAAGEITALAGRIRQWLGADGST